MTLNFCTLFDSNFLASGYTMYASLRERCGNFHLYIFAFDGLAAEILKQLNLPHVTVIALEDFEDDDLLRVKPDRNRAEYCWTCTSSTIKYCIEKFELNHCIYIDADLYFYGDPELIVRDVMNAGKDVLITAHNYAEKYDTTGERGKYCVQFMYFKNTVAGMEVLNWWRNACLEWCYQTVEDGKFGDQKYLDDWLVRYACVHECSLPGAGIAPWNVSDFDLAEQPNGMYSVKSCKTRCEYDFIFYHFHRVRLFSNAIKWGKGFLLPEKFIRSVYLPYSYALLQNAEYLKKINPKFALPKKRALFYRLIFNSGFYHIYRIKNGKILKS